ncbi:MAG: Mrp/NBP35 family ATP-binding protein [Anaerolineae bacterium]|nr:Mrp/NBP35 family ATP-binding protein [Anaerolineae bacterium]
MPTEQEIRDALTKVMDPELGKNIVELGMVRDIRITPDGEVGFALALTIPNCPLKNKMKADAEQALLALPGVKYVDVTFAQLSPAELQAAMEKGRGNLPQLNLLNKIDRVLCVLSGKGGVGKSSVTALLAVALAKQGKQVGILDADITGPSIPKLFGLPTGGLRGGEGGMLPAITCNGIKVVSINLLLKEEDAPVIWRGPMISGVIQQFWRDALWGSLDVLLVDMPPGTSDAAISVMQSLPVNGVVLVTSPQELAGMVVRKALNMTKTMNVPVAGVIENMAYFTCPDCGKQHDIFGPSHAGEIAKTAGAPLLARLPLRPQLAMLGDAGQIEEADAPEFEQIARQLMAME